jgi:hypothetical protein
MHVNKVHSVRTIDRVARELGESVDWLHEVAEASALTGTDPPSLTRIDPLT